MRKNHTSFVSGLVTGVLTVTMMGSALAAGGKVEYNRAGIALCGEPQVAAGETWTAPNGQEVPTMITYVDAAGGKTNYLSLRQISQMLAIPVKWNEAENRVEMGSREVHVEFLREGYLNAMKRSVAGEVPDKTPDTTLPNPEETVLRGDAKRIQARGGTLLPDDDPSAYSRYDGKCYKLFLSKDGSKLPEYAVGNRDALDARWHKLLSELVDGVYPVNSRGESYGNLQLIQYVGYAPDLAGAIGTQGERGYIDRKEALHPSAAEELRTTIPLYNAEHEVIGEVAYGGGTSHGSMG